MVNVHCRSCKGLYFVTKFDWQWGSEKNRFFAQKHLYENGNENM